MAGEEQKVPAVEGWDKTEDLKWSDGRAMLYNSCVSESAQQLSQRPDVNKRDS